LIHELLVLNKKWSDTRRKPEVVLPPNDTAPLANASYYKPGTPMTDNAICSSDHPKKLAVSPAEDAAKKVLAHGRTMKRVASNGIESTLKK
jgi:hypothetical protein